MQKGYRIGGPSLTTLAVLASSSGRVGVPHHDGRDRGRSRGRVERSRTAPRVQWPT